jgi:hypothetical protein
MIQKTIGEEAFVKLRDAGELLAISDVHNGKNCPAEKTLLKCAKASIACMMWNPIGKWETLDNGVMRLSSSICELTVFKNNGLEIKLSYTEGDLRYTTDDYITSYLAKTPQFHKGH